MLNSCVHFAACVTAVMRRTQKRHPGYASGGRAMVTQFLLSMYILLVVSCLLSDIPFFISTLPTQFDRKTGWANQQTTDKSIEEMTTAEVPPDANARIQQVHAAMVQLAGTGLVVTPQMTIVGLNPNADATSTGAPAAAAAATPAAGIPAAASSQVEAMAAAALDAAFGAAPAANAPASAASATPAAAPGVSSEPADPTKVGGSDSPTTSILVHNMFDKDEEDEEGWPNDIKEEYIEECGKHGKIISVLVMSNDPGGKIYATFETIDGARACGESLAGRFFDKRQLRAEFVQADDIPKSA